MNDEVQRTEQQDIEPPVPTAINPASAGGSIIRRLWRWIGGTWQWGSLFTAACGTIRLAEYAIALFLFALSAVAAISKIFHWKSALGGNRLEKAVRISGFIAVCVVLIISAVVTVNIQ